MKNYLFLLLALPLMGNAQTNLIDTLITTKGEIIPCEIFTLYPEKIAYKDINGNMKYIAAIDVLEKIIHGKPIIVQATWNYDATIPESNYQGNDINSAGFHLRQAANIWFAGFGISLIGGAIIATGALISRPGHNYTDNTIKAGGDLIITGGVVSGLGGLTMTFSFFEIHKAGRILDGYQPAQSKEK